MKNQTTGVELWRGNSPATGQPIVAVMTFDSTNDKTGNIPQVWILLQEMAPHTAARTGWDESVCGNCSHRLVNGGTCYVRLHQAPLGVWRAWTRGNYPRMESVTPAWMRQRIAGRPIRWGAYGDPAMVPADTFQAVQRLTTGGHRAYTHQWRQPWAQWLKGLAMASCDSLTDYLAASGDGWKTFRVVPQDRPAETGKKCPATIRGSLAQCRSCTQCDGAHGHIWVHAHGHKAGQFAG